MKRTNVTRGTRNRRIPPPTLVSTALFETIRAYKEAADGRLPSSVVLNKVSFLATVELAEEGIVVPLPYAWYKFGPEVEAVPRQVRYSVAPRPDAGADDDPRLFEPEYRTLVDWSGPTPDDFEGDTVAGAVRRAVDDLVHEFVDSERVELLVDRAYEFAPFDFQRRFRLARIKIGRTGRGSSLASKAMRADLGSLVGDAFDVFPADRFPRLAEAALQARRVVAYAWGRLDRRDALAAAEAIEQFWAAFASALRTVPDGRSRWVPADLVDDWRDLATRDLARCLRALGDLALRLARDDPDVRKDDVLGRAVETRAAERAEADRTIDDALSDVAELESILAERSNDPVEG